MEVSVAPESEEVRLRHELSDQWKEVDNLRQMLNKPHEKKIMRTVYRNYLYSALAKAYCLGRQLEHKSELPWSVALSPKISEVECRQTLAKLHKDNDQIVNEYLTSESTEQRGGLGVLRMQRQKQIQAFSTHLDYVLKPGPHITKEDKVVVSDAPWDRPRAVRLPKRSTRSKILTDPDEENMGYED